MDITTLSPDNFTYHLLNESLHFANVTSKASGPQFGKMFSIILKVVYVIGIVGNAVAIVCLRKGEKRVRNRKHLLLLTSLASNDIVALVGMMTTMVVSETFPWVGATRAHCAARVILRVFGIGSVCIAVTMALERYLALTRPFLYQKQVTYYVIRTALLVVWCWAAALTCAPVLGLGLYYDETTRSCSRYRNAVETTDVVYAWVYVMFGTLLCVILVYCNLAVIRALYEISAPRGAPVMRRVSKSSCRQRAAVPATDAGHHNPATAEEVAFSRLMAMLSVLFMVCWLPQMFPANNLSMRDEVGGQFARTVAITYIGANKITSSLYLSLSPRYWPRLAPLGAVSDLLMLLNYVLDPVLYVLMRRSRPRCLRALSHALAHCFKRNHKTSTESMKTSCCAQETLLVSDSSGAEMRPLRAQQVLAPAHLLD